MSKLIQHVEVALQKARQLESKITQDILNMEGMSGRMTRHFYNNVCSIPNARYLEIGSWKGSTFCAAMCGNEMTCLAIDNWSQLGGPREDFLKNYYKYKGKNKATVLEKNCWEIEASTLGKFNIFMYDGDHDTESHFRALPHYWNCLDDEFIFIVDDWNWEDVVIGTERAIRVNELKILFKEVIITDINPQIQRSDNNWHNGICIMILKKTKRVLFA